ncbi:hypothetical protein AB0J21_10405 [Streptomyces sp. NPDC049954]|uniref:hypothetical protein n=1 Tax=Streptomyces sp. NPDC049954 TaxID=3155779 RepID=UPI00341CD2EB
MNRTRVYAELPVPGGVVGEGCGGPVLLPRPLAGVALDCALRGVYEGPFAAPRGVPVLHPNGFVKLPVAVLPGTAGRLFLHVWLRDGEDSHIHNHRWDFTSTVLRGTLHNTLVDVGPGGDGPRLRTVRHSPEAGGFRFDGHGASWVRVTSLRTVALPEGAEYAMEARTLHRVRAEGGSMTLVTRGIPRRSWSDVLLDRPVEDGPRRMRPVGTAEREHYLRLALESLA